MLAMRYCMHDDLIMGFEGYPTVKDMWYQLRIRFDQIHLSLKTSNLRIVLLKWQRVEANREYKVARVKCYNCEKKKLTTWDCPKLTKVPSFTFNLNNMCTPKKLLLNILP